MAVNRPLEMLLRVLWQVGAVKFGEFELKIHQTNSSAPKSPIYLDLRTPDNPKPGPLTPGFVRMIGEHLAALVR